MLLTLALYLTVVELRLTSTGRSSVRGRRARRSGFRYQGGMGNLDHPDGTALKVRPTCKQQYSDWDTRLVQDTGWGSLDGASAVSPQATFPR